MPRKVVAILEVELVLSTLLCGGCSRVTVLASILQDGRPKLLVDEDASALFRHSRRNGGLEAIVDHLLGSGDLRRLLGAQKTLPAEHPCLERAAMVKGQNIQRFVISERHDVTSRCLWLRRMRTLVELWRALLRHRGLSSSRS